MIQKLFKRIFWRQFVLVITLPIAFFLLTYLMPYRQGYPLYFEEFIKRSLVLQVARIVYDHVWQKVFQHYQITHNQLLSDRN